MSDIERLREVAEAATQGTWAVADEGYDERYVYDEQTGQMCWTPDMPQHWSRVDADHIAAFDPPTVLALLDRLAAAEGAVARVREVHGQYFDTDRPAGDWDDRLGSTNPEPEDVWRYDRDFRAALVPEPTDSKCVNPLPHRHPQECVHLAPEPTDGAV